jgi:predicted amidophosphoribosyltransferase
MIVDSDKHLHLTFCHYCHKEVAKNAPTCPHCGGESPAMSEEQRSDHLGGEAWRTVLFGVVIIGIVIWAIKYL